MNKLISVIVTTYNWPEALLACLNSLSTQYDKNFEVIIADDGSTTSTKALITVFMAKQALNLRHVYHEDCGFRAGTIRNKAVALSQGEYLIFIDGDCITLPHFIARHRQMAETGYFVPGNRVLISQDYTQTVLQTKLALQQQSLGFFLKLRLSAKINRLLPLVYLPFSHHRYRQAKNWHKAMTCNLGVWKQDFLAINGFDEVFQGWGYEDSDLVIRLIHQGIRRKEGRFALPVLHLWHKQNDRSQHDVNYQRLLARVADETMIRAEMGVASYLSVGHENR